MTEQASGSAATDECIECGVEVESFASYTVTFVGGVPMLAWPESQENTRGKIESRAPYCLRCYRAYFPGAQR